MYFAHIFSLAHDGLEQFVQAAGYSWNQYFSGAEFIFPIRHAESDYRKPFLAGQIYELAVSVAQFSNSSFKLEYVFSKNELIHAVVQTVHTCLDVKSHTKTNLPAELKDKLMPYLKLKENN